MKKTKDFSFMRYFHPEKSFQPIFPEKAKHKKRHGTIMWRSANYNYFDDQGEIQEIRGQGTYVRIIHGLLPLTKKALKNSLKEFYKNNLGFNLT